MFFDLLIGSVIVLSVVYFGAGFALTVERFEKPAAPMIIQKAIAPAVVPAVQKPLPEAFVIEAVIEKALPPVGVRSPAGISKSAVVDKQPTKRNRNSKRVAVA